MTKEKPLHIRYASAIDSRIKDIQEMARLNDTESINTYGLSFEYVPKPDDMDTGYFRWQISWGGPSEEFRFFCDPSPHCYSVEFVYKDWGEYDGRRLDGENAIVLLDIFNNHFMEFDLLGMVIDATTNV